MTQSLPQGRGNSDFDNSHREGKVEFGSVKGWVDGMGGITPMSSKLDHYSFVSIRGERESVIKS
jgi:hypothetical protein